MAITRLLICVVGLALLGLGLGVPSAAADITNPKQADGPGIITIEQLNMCMWGSAATPGCFPNPYDESDAGWRDAELQTAAEKRASIVTQFDRHIPDVVTVSEGCLGDLQQVAETVGYELAYVSTGNGTDHKPRECSADRGIGVNAILAKNITGTGPTGYFQDPGWRSYVCAQVSTDEWDSVRVCTAHLSLKSQDDRQPIECSQLRDDILDPSQGSVLFAGDVNMSRDNEHCAPSRFHGIKDLARSAEGREESKVDGLQHIYYSANGFYRQSCGWAYTVEHTDHPGFLLELGKKAPDQDVSCDIRNIRS